MVSFHGCDEVLSEGTPDFSTDWLVEPATTTDNFDGGFDTLFEVVDPDTGEVLGAEINMNALEAETEKFELIGETASGFLLLTTSGLTTSTATSYIHIVRLTTYEQLAGGE